ncbi:MAG TPA: hypothetical protein VK426_10420, partial [Methanobacterium sp.]|nr:hypothetical protein [Methanobacterium sp.]
LSYVQMKHWSPFDSWESFKFELNNIEKNIYHTVNIINSFYLVTFLIIISIIIFVLNSNAQKPVKDKLVYLLITLLLYVSGYILIYLEWRYLWLVFILIVISGFYLVQSIYNTKIINKNLRNILLIILIFSFTIEPAYEIISLSNPTDPFYELSNKLENDYGIHGNIASNKFGDTMRIAYYLNIKYYGQTKKTNNSADLEKELETNNIDYYFFWGEEYKFYVPNYYYWNESDTIILPGYQEITNGKIKGLKIYSKLKNN